MTNRSIKRTFLACSAALATLALATTSLAEVLTYDFTATIDSADATELATIGFPASGEITGSLTYDSDAGRWGGSSSYGDPTLDLTLDQMSATTDVGTWLRVSYRNDELNVQELGYDESNTAVRAHLELTGQDADFGDLPSSLSFGSGSGGTLQLYVGSLFGDMDLSASLTSLTLAGGDVPELDPVSGAGALALLLGGALLIADRRRRMA